MEPVIGSANCSAMITKIQAVKSYLKKHPEMKPSWDMIHRELAKKPDYMSEEDIATFIADLDKK
jgi:hypothetical protein